MIEMPAKARVGYGRLESTLPMGVGGWDCCGLLLVNQYAALSRALTFDEVDYVQAARHGLLDNYLERGSLSFLQFVALARAKAVKDTHAVELLAPSLPPENDSLEYLRHDHPPLMFYLLRRGRPARQPRTHACAWSMRRFL